MLSKKHRLTKNKEFDNVFKNGRGSYNKAIGIKVVKNELDQNRLGIMVGLKISKKAVERNRVKRLIREIIKLELAKIKPGYDIVIIAQPEILGLDYQEVKKNIFFHLNKLRLSEN